MGELLNMHWTALKKLVEANGGEYTDKAAAISFLMANGIAAPVATEPVAQPAKHLVTANTATLDRALPFGTISGDFDECPTARFVQGGSLFDSQGKKVG